MLILIFPNVLKFLAKYLEDLDQMSWEDRQLSLAKGLLAGNVFDWGAKEVAAIMETQEFGFNEAKSRLQGIVCQKNYFEKF